MEQSTGNSGFEKPAGLERGVGPWTEIVREKPIASLAIAAALGFIIGGGIRQPGSLPVLTMFGQIIVWELFGDTVLSDRSVGKM
jgi:hypothetical protein